MKKINPLTILLICFSLFLASLVMEKKSKLQLKEANYNVSKFNELASEYNSLNKNWNKKEIVKKRLDKIIKSSKIKNIDKKVKTRTTVLSFKESSITKIDKFVNKILNENLVIKKLLITKNSVVLEIKN